MTIDRPAALAIPLRSPELLAPAGSWDCAKAAVENGADAIYFGLERFNARMRAHNFTEADLPELMAFLHRRGVKGYVTLNTLIFTAELADAEQYLRTIIAAGVDAAIVQDVGMCRLIRQLSPDFPIHGSTQMTVTNAAGVEFARSIGCDLVVLARECSIPEINKIQAQLRNQNIALPLEVFVHGALCVAYSGQCLTSEALGGRSANRGECAQACRMPYELVVDGKSLDLGDRNYLLSPQDLAGLEVLPDLIQTGVTSLKIEGRLKTPEYVAAVTRTYRQAIDRIMQGLEHEVSEGDTVPGALRDTVPGALRDTVPGALRDTVPGALRDRYTLEMAFSRGLYTGWLGGIDNQALVHAQFGKKRGVYLGEVTRVYDGRDQQVSLMLQAPLKAGDGVVFDAGKPQTQEQGGRIYSIESRGGETLLTFGRQAIDLRRVKAGDRLWKTSDPELDRQIRQTFAGDQPQFQRAIDLEVHGAIGQPLTAIVRDRIGHVVEVASTMPLVEAQNQQLTLDRLQAQFGRLGNTPFRLGMLANHLQGAVLLPVSELNRMRREFVAQLEQLRAQPQRWQLHSDRSYLDLLPKAKSSLSKAISPTIQSPPELGDLVGFQDHSLIPNSTTAPELIVLVRNLKQLEVAIESNVQTLYCEFEDVRLYRQAVQQVRQSSDSTVWVAPPRITKPGESYILQQVRASEADGYLVRNYDHLKFFAGDRCAGDFSLNVANPIAADYFKSLGLERLTAAYDLNIAQLEALLKHSPPEWFEITIHQHMPMFHMEHCVFCAFLSDGTDYTDCGRPCEKHEVKLRDRVGTEHILQADAGCRNTVFNGTAQTGAESVRHLIKLGVRHFRLEFVSETLDRVRQTIDRYQKLLQGQITGSQLWRELKLQNQLGVTRGTLDESPKPVRR